MKRLIVIWLMLGLPFFTIPIQASTVGEVKVGQVLHDAPLHHFLGGSRQLSELIGKPLLINVWASWCGPCRAEMDSLERLSRRFGGKPFKVVGISTDDDPKAAYAFIKRTGVTFENYIDKHLVLENMLGADRIPLTVLVDSDGRVLAKVHGSQQWDSLKWINFIGLTFSE